MKKLLFVTALLAMGTMAMGAEQPTLGANDTAKADVKVRAEIVDDKFKITDIYGQPLILDFQEVMKATNTDVTTSVRYKVTTKEALDGANSAEFKMAILGDNTDQGSSKVVKITRVKSAELEDNLQGDEKTSLNVALGIDNETKYLLKGESEFQGIISGRIKEDTSKHLTGEYIGYATLKATVGEVK